MPEEVSTTGSPTVGSEIGTLLDIYSLAIDRGKSDIFRYKQGGEWRSVSSAELDGTVRALACGLHGLGIRAESHVGLLAENSVEWIYADLGILHCGASDVPIYPTHAPKQVAYILNDAGVEVLFISTRAQLERIREALAECSRIRAIISFEKIECEDDRVMSLAEFLKFGRSIEAQSESESAGGGLFTRLSATVEPESTATLIYTSGTTGDPKGVVLTHGNLTSNVLINARLAELKEGEAALSFLPFSHIFERNWIYMCMRAGVSVSIASSVDAVSRELVEVRPHVMTSVPRLYEKIYNRAMEKAEAGGKLMTRIARWAIDIARQVAFLEDRGERPGAGLRLRHKVADLLILSRWRGAMGGRMRAMVSGGAALSPDLAFIFLGAGLRIYQGYGLTETSPTISTNHPGANRIGSVGRPIDNVRVRIAEDGEILCSGPNVMRGYYQKTHESMEALEADVDGRIWFHTGDIGHLDADGFLFITDRKKDLLKTSGGKYIAPQPIENAIKSSRYVNQVVVIGDSRKFPAAIIIPNFDLLRVFAEEEGLPAMTPGEMTRDPRIIALIEAEVDRFTPDLARYEKIKGVLLLDRELTVEAGDLTPTLKVRRRVVNETLKPLIDRLYAEKEGYTPEKE